MGKKRKHKMPAAVANAMHWFKVPLKLSTHVFTIAGVVVAASPVLPGITALAHGDASGAAASIRSETIGTQASVADSAKTAIVKVAIPIALGIGLVWSGAQLRKRIGN